MPVSTCEAGCRSSACRGKPMVGDFPPLQHKAQNASAGGAAGVKGPVAVSASSPFLWCAALLGPACGCLSLGFFAYGVHF